MTKVPLHCKSLYCTVAAVVANCFIRKVVDEKGPPPLQILCCRAGAAVVARTLLTDWLFLPLSKGDPWTNVRRMQFSPSFKVTVPCDIDAKKLCKARAILTPQIFWLTRFKDKGIEFLNTISGQSLVTLCIFGRKQTHKRWFKIFSAVFQIINIKSIQSYKLKRA